MLKRDASDGYALANLAFVVKSVDRDYEEAARLFAAAVATGDAGTDDSRYYIYWADCLTKIGRRSEVLFVYLSE